MTTSPTYQSLDLGRRPKERDWMHALRRGANAFAVHSLFHSMNALGVMRVPAHEQVDEVHVDRDIFYGQTRDAYHTLDVWQPRVDGPAPAVVFIHGGAFRTMSKDTHWNMARAFARMGYVVFSINYRLGPKWHYPAPLEDACEALGWIVRHADAYNVDPQRLVFAGESAGANLALGLALTTLVERPEPWAQEAFALGVSPKAVVAACGILQVSDIERYKREHDQPFYVMAALRDAATGYLPAGHPGHMRASLLADPLNVLEQLESTERPMPAIFAPVGGKDPLQHDSLRLERAARALGARAKATVYPKGAHSFMAMMWTQHARACWADIFSFLDEALATSP